jgi:hypothetical protein
MLAVSLAGGAGVFGAFIVLFTFAVIYSLYTRTGSAINQRPYGTRYGSAPGARVPNSLSHDQSAATRYTRGTRG